MLRFQKSILINAPRETVWGFHERPDILKKLTPPWQPVTIVAKKGGLEVGAIAEFRITIGIVPVKWVDEHIQCNPPHSFTDIQIEGPMTSWRHEHQFMDLGKQTRLIDTIDYEIPGGSASEFCLGWWVNSRLEEMFKYRHQVTKNECEILEKNN